MKIKKNKVIRINLKKFIRSILIIIGITIIVTFLATKSIYSYKKAEYKTIYVEEGETLWSIAKDEQINNKFYEGKNIREVIYDIKKLNSMSDANILPGESIKIYYQ